MRRLADNLFIPIADKRREPAAQIQARAFAFLRYIPTEQLVGRRAFRKTLAGVLDAPLLFLLNIERRPYPAIPDSNVALRPERRR